MIGNHSERKLNSSWCPSNVHQREADAWASSRRPAALAPNSLNMHAQKMPPVASHKNISLPCCASSNSHGGAWRRKTDLTSWAVAELLHACVGACTCTRAPILLQLPGSKSFNQPLMHHGWLVRRSRPIRRRSTARATCGTPRTVSHALQRRQLPSSIIPTRSHHVVVAYCEARRLHRRG